MYASQADHAILICSGWCGSERSWSLFAFAVFDLCGDKFCARPRFYNLASGEFYECLQSRGCVRSVVRLKF
nr:hypothetical protein [uncultured Campylobacter sp.]